MREGTYSNGQRKTSIEGQVLTHYFKDGSIKAQGKIIDGLMDGRWIFNKKQGYLWQVGHFLKGERQGSWTRYNPDGTLADKKEFKDDKPIK